MVGADITFSCKIVLWCPQISAQNKSGRGSFSSKSYLVFRIHPIKYFIIITVPSKWNIYRVPALCEGNLQVTGGKQSRRRWCETPWHSLNRHCNVLQMWYYCPPLPSFDISRSFFSATSCESFLWFLSYTSCICSLAAIIIALMIYMFWEKGVLTPTKEWSYREKIRIS